MLAFNRIAQTKSMQASKQTVRRKAAPASIQNHVPQPDEGGDGRDAVVVCVFLFVAEWHGDALKIREYAICYRMYISRASGTACDSVLGRFCVLVQNRVKMEPFGDRGSSLAVWLGGMHVALEYALT